MDVSISQVYGLAGDLADAEVVVIGTWSDLNRTSLAVPW